MSQSEQNSNTQQIPLEIIASALVQLGYPETAKLDAATRISWVPELAADLIEFVRMGAPKFDPNTGQPPRAITRPLRDGHTVASLMDDYLQNPTGAFLLGAALITHYDEAVGMLEKMVTDGIYIKKPDGKYVNMEVPAADKFPDCPSCGTKLFRKSAFCPECGSPTGVDQQA